MAVWPNISRPGPKFPFGIMFDIIIWIPSGPKWDAEHIQRLPYHIVENMEQLQKSKRHTDLK